jgi:hypothetical protein
MRPFAEYRALRTVNGPDSDGSEHQISVKFRILRCSREREREREKDKRKKKKKWDVP